MPTSREPIDAEPAQHRALLYGDAIEFVEAVVPFVRDGLRAGEAILVALAEEKLEWFREELGDAADAVETADAAMMYARNGPMLSSLLQRFVIFGTPGEGQIRVVAEQPLAARTPVEMRAYLRYEAAANVAYRPFAASVLCPYDTSTLPDTVLQHALQTHPHVLDGATARDGEAFIEPQAFIRRHSFVERPPPDAVGLALEHLGDIAPVRHRIAQLAEDSGLARSRIDELVLAASELATNALVHGAAPRRIWVYEHEGAFICQFQDGGRGLPDPLAGYLVPELTSRGGRGLWLAHQLCDTVKPAHDEPSSRICIRMTL